MASSGGGGGARAPQPPPPLGSGTGFHAIKATLSICFNEFMERLSADCKSAVFFSGILIYTMFV